MSNRRSKPTVERRNGAKSKALRMVLSSIERLAGQAGSRAPISGHRRPVAGPEWRPAEFIWFSSRHFQAFWAKNFHQFWTLIERSGRRSNDRFARDHHSLGR